MSPPLDNGAFGKAYSMQARPYFLASRIPIPHVSITSENSENIGWSDKARPENHGQNAYLGLHPSSKEHDATTTLPAIRHCGGSHMVNGQVRDSSLGS